VQRPAADGLTDRFESFVTGRRTERDAKHTPPPPRQPRPEGIAEKVELVVGIRFAPVVILAVDYLRLLGMQHQLAGREAVSKCAP